MTVKEFYENIHGNYEDILSRLSTDEVIIHFIRRFPSDNTYKELMEAVQKSDISASFEAAHKLKGIAANLAFSELFSNLTDLSNQLRAKTEPANMSLINKVSDSYHTVLNEINNFKEDGRS